MKTIQQYLEFLIYPSPYSEARIYGTGKWLRRYGFYPPMIPLCVMTDHAPGGRSPPLINSELTTSAPAIFYHLASNAELFNKTNKNVIACTYQSLFVFCRKKLAIAKSSDSTGTLYFLAHGTKNLSDTKSVVAYLGELKELSRKYLPVSLCVHYNEERNGVANMYRKAGFDVYCAGDPASSGFIERFYSIVCRHKYVASNHFGSYALYAVELGIPFFLYGSPPCYHNSGDTNYKMNSDIVVESEYMQQAESLFRNFDKEEPTKAQAEFSAYYLGLSNEPCRARVSCILYYSLIVYILSLPITVIKMLANRMLKRNV